MSDSFLSGLWGNIIGDIIFGVIAGLFAVLWRQTNNKLRAVTKGKLVKSPMGTDVAYEIDGEVYLNSRGDIRNITRSRARDYNVVWSPDGEYIAFQSRAKSGRIVLMVADKNLGKAMALLEYPAMAQQRAFSWLHNGGIMVDFGGSATIIKQAEIDRKLNGLHTTK